MDGLRVVVFNNTGLVDVARTRLTCATIVPIDSQEEFFEQGKIPGTEEPRWSVARNVLHWVN